jgi:acetylornithine deacetylase/succinyl-diaminopimelate desuccinylase-like protein
MCKILSAIEEYGSSYPSDPLLGKPTASVGKISGGQKANVVPDLCEAEIDFRFLPSQTPEMVIDEVKRIIKELANKDRTLAWETEIIRYRLPFSIDLNAALVKALKSSYKASTGMSLPTKGFLSPGDAEHLIASGIPTIIFGPGDESTAHVSNEWISLEEVHQALIIYAETILRFIENRSDDKENKS